MSSVHRARLGKITAAGVNFGLRDRNVPERSIVVLHTESGRWVATVQLSEQAGVEPAQRGLGGVALAMTLGVLVVIVPSGIGVREAIIVGALSPVLSSSDALAVALVARLVFTLADLLAALAVLPIRIERPTPAPR